MISIDKYPAIPEEKLSLAGIRESTKWKVDTERDALDFDAGYYEKLLGKARDEVAFVFDSSKR